MHQYTGCAGKTGQNSTLGQLIEDNRKALSSPRCQQFPAVRASVEKAIAVYENMAMVHGADAKIKGLMNK